MKSPISKNFHVQLNSLSSVKTGKSSLARGHMGGGGGGRLGVPGVGTRDPRRGFGGPYTRKKFFKTQIQIHTQVRSGQVLPATTVRRPAKCVRRQDVWPNTHTQNTENRCRFRWNLDAQKGLQPVDEDYLTQRGLQLVKANRGCCNTFTTGQERASRTRFNNEPTGP